MVTSKLLVSVLRVPNTRLSPDPSGNGVEPSNSLFVESAWMHAARCILDLHDRMLGFALVFREAIKKKAMADVLCCVRPWRRCKMRGNKL